MNSSGGHGPAGLDIVHDERQERFESAARRAGWLTMASLVVAAVLGLFGNGLLSYVSDHSPDGSVHLRFDRFVRLGTPAEVVVEIAEPSDETVRLAVDRSYLGNVDVERVTPIPKEVQSVGDRLVYSFAAAPSAARLKITFRVAPDAVGTLAGGFGLPGRAPASVSQFAYP